MLEKVPGETAWKTAEKVTDKVLFQGHNVTSLKLKRQLCWRQLGTAMNLVLHTSLHISAKSPHAQSHFAELSRSVRLLAKCRNLRTLPGTKFRLPGTFNYSAPLQDTIL